MATKKNIGSINIAETDYGKTLAISKTGDVEFVNSTGKLIDTLIMSAVTDGAAARTNIPSSIAGVVSNEQIFGGNPSSYYYIGDLGDFDVTSSETYDADSTYLIKIELSQNHSNGSSGAIFYGIKPQDAATDVLKIGAQSSRSGSSGHGYSFAPLTAVGVFKWKPTASGNLTLSFTSLQSTDRASGCVVQIFNIA